jgi:hypothetical protein
MEQSDIRAGACDVSPGFRYRSSELAFGGGVRRAARQFERKSTGLQ